MFKFSTTALVFAVAVFWSLAPQALGKIEAISKRETSEEASKHHVSFLAKTAVLIIANTVDPSKKGILTEKFNKAAEKKWHNDSEYMEYCMKLLQDETGVDLTDSLKSSPRK